MNPHLPRHSALHFLRVSLPLAALTAIAATPAAPAHFHLGASGGLQSLQAGDDTLSFTTGSGGFTAYDVTNKQPIDLSRGTLKQTDGGATFDSDGSGGVSLHAEFIARDGYVQVQGRLQNTQGDARAVILDYWAGFGGKGAIFSNSINPANDHAVAAAELEGNAVPVAAVNADGKGLAMGIPPDQPRSFGMVASPKGLATRFYLGISPATARFPNQASFSFLIFPSENGWGCRAALEKYYSFFPENYRQRSKRDGLWLFQVKGIVPENIKQYGFNVLELQNKDVAKDLNRDEKNNVGDMAYTLVGQREVKFLDVLPKTYDQAIADLDHWTVEQSKAHAVTKENTPAGGDLWLKEEISSSACKDYEGKYAIEIRDTPWGRKSVSFKINPSPYLFADQSVRTVGKDSIALIDQWIKQYPQIGGVLVDSLGANWPAVMDYRPDHFKYSQYPLTFDPQGHLAINNAEGHYEFLKALKADLDATGRLMFGNGVYAYKTSKTPEHYRATDFKHRVDLGRFFMAALLDGGSSEVGSKADVNRCQDARVLMGRKYYALINYEWKDADKVEEFFNRALCYGIFASNTKFYPPGEGYVEGGNEGIGYVDNPDGYLRDKDLLKWYVPKARQLYEAGWEPVTHARVAGGSRIWVERYGSGNSVYFTVFNDSPEKKKCTLEVDLAALGFTEGVPDYKELARGVEPELVAENKIGLTLDPFKTYIVNMTKPWLVGAVQSTTHTTAPGF